MQRVLLVKPDASFALDVAPPVGLGYLGASIRQAGHDIRCFDNRLKGQEEDDMFEMIRTWKPNVVGFSAFSYELMKVLELARKVREINPDTVLLAGGPLASADPEGALGEGVVDAAIQGEGEAVTVNMLERLERGQSWHDLDGVAYWKDGKAVVNPIQSVHQETWTTLPSPAWDLLDVRELLAAAAPGLHLQAPRLLPGVHVARLPLPLRVLPRRLRQEVPPAERHRSVLEEIRDLVEEPRLQGDPLHR